MFERQIVRMPVNGVVRTVIMTSGKQATYDVLDAETGKWIYSKDLGLQNFISSIDPVTGKKNINAGNAAWATGRRAFSAPMWTAPRAGFRARYNPEMDKDHVLFRWLRRVWIWRR